LSDNSTDEPTKQEVANDSSTAQNCNLCKGWLTGYAYNACKSLYFKGTSLTDKEKNGLISWLYTYNALMKKWGVTAENLEKTNPSDHSNADSTGLDTTIKQIDSVLINGENINIKLSDPAKTGSSQNESGQQKNNNLIEIMIKEIKNDTTPHSVNESEFDNLYNCVTGLSRVEGDYSYYAILVAAKINTLNYSKAEKINQNLTDLKDELANLATSTPTTAIPNGAFPIITADIEDLIQKSEILKSITEKVDKPEGEKKQDTTTTQQKKEDALKQYFKQVTQEWSALFLGTLSVKDTLTERGKAILHILVALIAIIIVLAFGIPIFALFYELSIWLHVDFSTLTLIGSDSSGANFLSAISTVVTILTGLGFSLTVLVKKAWSSMDTFELTIAIWLAKHNYFRRVNQKGTIKQTFEAKVADVRNSLPSSA
jgi:hypothetical protein